MTSVYLVPKGKSQIDESLLPSRLFLLLRLKFSIFLTIAVSGGISESMTFT